MTEGGYEDERYESKHARSQMKTKVDGYEGKDYEAKRL